MDDLTKKYLQDILTAIEEIDGFFGDGPRLFETRYRKEYRDNRRSDE